MASVIKHNRWFITVSLILLLTQMFFDSVNLLHLSDHTSTIISACIMFLGIVSTGFKQYFDKDIPNETLILPCLAFMAFVAGGVLDAFDKFPFTEEQQAIIRSILIFIQQGVPVALKYLVQLENK